MPVSAKDTVKALVNYLSLHIKNENEIPRARRALAALSETAISALVEEFKQKEREATKDFIRENWKANLKEDLEKRKDFVRWLDKLNGRGHQMYEVVCDDCSGTGVRIYVDPRFPSQCARCQGTGKQTRPQYCKVCDGLWPHYGVCQNY